MANWIRKTLGRVRLPGVQVAPIGRRKTDHSSDHTPGRGGVPWEVIAIIVQILIVLPSAWLYVTSRGERTKARQYQAWEVVASSHGRGWSGGRDLALEDLNRGGISLRAVDLSGAQMDSLRLPNADLKFARMPGTRLSGADLHGAKLARTTLRGANLGAANLRDAEFAFAHADSVLFDGARLCGALFIGADLRGSRFSETNLRDAQFDGADLRGAIFPMTDLPPGASFREANIEGMRAPESFVRQARATGAVTQSQGLWELYRGSHERDWRDRWVAHDSARILRGADRKRDCPDLRPATR